MVTELKYTNENIKCERKIGISRWNKYEEIMLSQWMIANAACPFDLKKIKETRINFSDNDMNQLKKLFSSLNTGRILKVKNIKPVLSPALQSALKTIDTANELTQEEIIALNNLIGNAPVKNEFDIEKVINIECEMNE